MFPSEAQNYYSDGHFGKSLKDHDFCCSPPNSAVVEFSSGRIQLSIANLTPVLREDYVIEIWSMNLKS